MATKQELDLIDTYLSYHAESDTNIAFEQMSQEFRILRTVIENNNAEEWLAEIVDTYLDDATEWEQDNA